MRRKLQGEAWPGASEGREAGTGCARLRPAAAHAQRPPPPQRLQEELRLHRCSTRECIEQYYLDKLKQVRGSGAGAPRPQRPIQPHPRPASP